MHGLEPQTLESLEHAADAQDAVHHRAEQDRPDVRLEDANDDFPTRETLATCRSVARASAEFEDRAKKVMLEFANEGLERGDLLGQPGRAEVHQRGARRRRSRARAFRIMIHTLGGSDADEDERTPSVLRRGAVHGPGGEDARGSWGPRWTSSSSTARFGRADTIVVGGLQGAIVTTIRALLTPQPMREMRVKANYVHHKEISAAMGIKIVAKGLEQADRGDRDAGAGTTRTTWTSSRTRCCRT